MSETKELSDAEFIAECEAWMQEPYPGLAIHDAVSRTWLYNLREAVERLKRCNELHLIMIGEGGDVMNRQKKQIAELKKLLRIAYEENWDFPAAESMPAKARIEEILKDADR